MPIGPQSSICHATLVHKKYSIKETLFFEDVSGGFACQPSCLGVLGFSKKTFQRAMHPSLLPLHSLAANQKRNQSDLIFLHLSWPMLKRSLMSWLQLDLEKCTELFHVLSIVYMNSIVRLGFTDESFASCFLQDFYL